ncbi:MAG: efflux RND transporter permease subunit [Bacteroidales bacterium]|nr:efflux RND transporter permease subunit [Bacteroidales bacterium]
MAKRRETFVQGTIKYKSIIYLILAALVGIGIYGLVKMNKDEFPTFEITQGLVVGVYPGATAAEVEEQLTKPLEQTLFGFSEVSRATSSYSKDGICYIYVEMHNLPISKKDEVWSRIKLALDNKKAFLPPGVLAVQVIDDFSSISSILISLESPDKDYAEMKGYADELCDRLRELDKLSYAKLYGERGEEIAVNIDMDKLSAYGLDPTMLMLDYQTAGLNILSGEFDTDYTNAPIHVTGLTGSEQEVAEKIVYSDPSGNVIRLRDIATVSRQYEKPSELVKYNGGTCLIISVEMRPDNDIVQFGRDVDEVLDEFRSSAPESITISKITDQPKVVGGSVWGFVRDLGISMLVVILVMLLIFPFRSAMIAGLGVPLCTIVAVAVMYATGMSLNTVTLAALITVLGMIVDDAIVSIDGYMGYLRQGCSRLEAATRSTKELAMPMALATFAIGFMLFPLLKTMTGYMGAFVKSFPWIILIALTASLVYALTIVPPLEIRFIKSAESGNGAFARLQGKFFNVLQNGYEWLERRCFNHPYISMAIGAVVIVAGGLMFLKLNVQMLPMAERDCFAVEIFLDSNSGIDDTEAVCDSLQAILNKDSRITSVTSFIGSGSPRFHATYIPKVPAKNYAQLIVNTTSTDATVEVLKDYGAAYENYFPNAQIRFKQIDYQAVNAPVEVIFKGGAWEEMKPYADSLKQFMRSRPDLMAWVHTDIDDYMPTIDVTLDPDEAARLGVNKTLLALNLYGTYNGLPVGAVWEGDTKIPVVVYSDDASRQADYSVLGNQMIATAVPGVSVPLRQVADVSPDWQPESIPHLGGCQTVSVLADMAPGKSHPQAMKVVKKYIDETLAPTLPEGVTIEYKGLTGKNDEVVPQIIVSFICAVAVLFLFLLIHFKKISLAVTTIILSLISLFGATLGLWVFGLDFGITSVLGFVSLVGITVKNGIIIFEDAENLRYDGGMDVKTAAFEAGRRRMRPIFLASCTTALGVLPMIISHSALWMPLGVVICFGILFSIVLLVLIMPVTYWQLFKNARHELTEEEQYELESAFVDNVPEEDANTERR